MMPVQSGTQYVFARSVAHLAFYGFDKKFISYAGAVGAATPFSTPDDAFFVRFSQTLSTGADTQMLTKGTSKPSVYMGYGWRDWYSQDLKSHQQTVELFNRNFPGANLVNRDQVLMGYALSTNGSVTSNASYFVTDFIPVAPLATYICNKASNVVCCYDVNLKKVDVLSIHTNTPFTTQASAAYIRMHATPLNTADVLMVLHGNEMPSDYVPFGAPNKQDIEYVQAIKDVCSLFSVPVCDLFNESGVNLYNLSVFTLDNLHPNDVGAERISPNLVQQFNTVL